MNCPYCQQEMIIPKEEVRNGIRCCVCRNPKCDFDGWHFPVKTITELAKTKQALDVAVMTLKEIDETRCVPRNSITTIIGEKIFYAGNVVCVITPDQIHNALYQIKQITETKE